MIRRQRFLVCLPLPVTHLRCRYDSPTVGMIRFLYEFLMIGLGRSRVNH
uniref:Uncharacterized protein n=1 Tax=Picea glauca TaxID=3330 RepID=A0A117NI94_PICGL|nr:hypothetical protein ABT39_MTgene2818 [Picea glauca]